MLAEAKGRKMPGASSCLLKDTEPQTIRKASSLPYLFKSHTAVFFNSHEEMLFPYPQPPVLRIHSEEPILDNSLLNTKKVLPSQQPVCAKIETNVLMILSSI